MMGPWLAVVLAVLAVVLVRTPWRAARVAGLAALGAAALRMAVWESYPDLLGGTMAPLWLRTAGYLAVVGACLAMAAAYWRRSGDGRAFRGLLLGAVSMAFWWITFEATYALDARHHGRVAGNEGLLVVGVWALYGLVLALADRWFTHFYVRQSARFMLALGLVWLVLGAFLANARWADPGYRWFGYLAVLLSTWAAEGLLQRHGEDHQMQGLAGLAAAVAGLFVAAFELRLWLDNHLFFFELEVRRTAESFAYEASVRTYALLAVWGLWAFG
ncbi:MAG TPA: hypothetical protein VNT01_09080, partial [Symbiobacteriaceae bacterium]|nr:hypothetical protein [Symbiobacteriaceae bacterium]